MGFLQWLFSRTPSRVSGAEADALIDRLVAVTDRRLAFVKGYREAVRPRVAAARDAMREAVARIPGPTEVSAAAWSLDDTVRVLFAHRDDVAPAFSRDEGVRAFCGTHANADCFALLGLEQHTRRVLAPMLHGDQLHAEVARTTVSFGAPRILDPRPDAPAVRERLAVRALEYLALRALEQVGAEQEKRAQLERERSLLQARLRLATRQSAGFTGFLASNEERAQIEGDLERTVRELEDAAPRTLLPALLEALLATLERPGDHLTIEPCAIALDAMNFVTEPSPTSLSPAVAILSLARREPYAVLIARFPRGELLPAGDRLGEASKYL
jgi:hypothetical protein